MTENKTTTESNIEEITNPLETKITELESQLAEAEGAKLRALADLSNFRRRENESRATWSRDAVSEWVKQIIPSLQELMLGAEHTTDKDIKAVITKFSTNLEKIGLEKINPAPGTLADHDLHEVLMTAEGKPGTIVQVLESGWKLNDKVIIPAKISGAPLS